MTKEDDEDFKNTKCCICDNTYVDDDLKVNDHCHITGKYRGLHIEIAKLNHETPVVFHNVKKKCDIHLIMQELGKFSLKINVIPIGLEKYLSFNINNNLISIDTFQFLSSSLVKKLGKDDFKYLSQ